MLYEIHIDNNADGAPEITYAFEFPHRCARLGHVPYNTGPIDSIASPSWNRRQFYSVTRVNGGHRQSLGRTDLPCPPCNIGPASTPNYAGLAGEAVHKIAGGHTVFAGQRLEGFYVDLGAIFDLGDLRPFGNLHLFAAMSGGARGGRHQRLRAFIDRAEDPQAQSDPRRSQNQTDPDERANR